MEVKNDFQQCVRRSPEVGAGVFRWTCRRTAKTSGFRRKSTERGMGAGFFVNLVTKNSRGDGTASTDSSLKEKKALIYSPFFQFRGSLDALNAI